MELIRVPLDSETPPAGEPPENRLSCGAHAAGNAPEGALFLSRVPGGLEPLPFSITQLVEADMTEIVCLAHGVELRLLSPDYAYALDTKQLPFQVTRFPIDRNGAPLDVAGFGAVAVSIAAKLTAGRNVLLHGGLTFGRSATLGVAVRCVCGASLEVGLGWVRALGLSLNGAQQLALRRLFDPGLTPSELIQPIQPIQPLPAGAVAA